MNRAQRRATSRATPPSSTAATDGKDPAGTAFNSALLFALSHACNCHACAQLCELAPILAAMPRPQPAPAQP